MATKVHTVKDTVFPVVIYGCEIWAVKKAEGRRTDAFELQCWRRLFRQAGRGHSVPLPAPASSDFVVVYRQISGLLLHILKLKLDLPESPCTRIRGLKPQKDSNLEYSALTQTSQHHMHEEKKQKRPLVLKSSLFSHHPMWQEWVKLSRRPGLHRENSTLTG